MILSLTLKEYGVKLFENLSKIKRIGNMRLCFSFMDLPICPNPAR